MTNMQSRRRRGTGAEQPDQRVAEAVADRLVGLLPEEALQDALKGLEGEEITGPGGLLSQLAGRVIQTALESELTGDLGHPPGGVPGSANVRNGSTAKTVSTDLGPVEVRTRATATAALSLSWSRNARLGWPGWTTRSSLSTPAACRCVTSRRT